MWRLFALALPMAVLCAGQATSQSIKNVRMMYGPYGAVRTTDKFLPRDVLFLSYEVDGLKLEKKTTKASWEWQWEVLDSKKKPIKAPQKVPPQEALLQLGGHSVPGDLVLEMPDKGDPGRYYVKVSVRDRNSKTSASIEHKFDLGTEKEFGIWRLTAPGFGVPGAHYPISFGVVNAPVWGANADKKKGQIEKLPEIDISMRIYEGKTEVATPVFIQWPAQLPGNATKDLIPAELSIYLNRPGRFVADLEVHEKVKGSKIKVALPFTVLDLK
jgi:hypothetical protein